jgi:hypothetical protein
MPAPTLVLDHTPHTIEEFVYAATEVLPTRKAADLAAAHWCVETAAGVSCYGQNPGNLTCGAAPNFPCGRNPLVTSPIYFAEFVYLQQGAKAYVDFIQAHGGYQALYNGDLAGYSQALSNMGYAGPMAASVYQSQIGAYLPQTQAVVIAPATSGPSIVGALAWAAALGVGGLFLGSWAAEGFKRPKIPPFWERARWT